MLDENSPERIAIQNAREALRRGDHVEARGWAEAAARMAPNSADPLLILAAVSEPRASLEYAKRALVLAPESQRARKAVSWARSRFGADVPAEPIPSARRVPRKKRLSRNPLFPALIFGLGCIVVAFAAWSAGPVLASFRAEDAAPTPTLEQVPQFAQAEFAKPTYTPAWTFTPSATPTTPPTSTPTITPTPEITNTPLPTETPLATNTTALLDVVVLVDTPTSIAPPTKEYVVAAAPVGNGVRWIDVDLTNQRLYAYEGDFMVNAFTVSTGTWQTPTVTGKFKVWIKVRSQTMSGPGYSLPGVPYVMYFYGDYGIHGTYWHNNFGIPMSHGCINLTIPDAEWLYSWASVGTVVNVHY